MVSKTKRVKLGVILAVLAIFAVLLGVLAVGRFEGQKPAMSLELDSHFISKTQELGVVLKDGKSGLRRLWISLVKDGKEITLVEENFPGSAIRASGEFKEKRIIFHIDPEKLGLSDGDATLRMAAWDYSILVVMLCMIVELKST